MDWAKQCNYGPECMVEDNLGVYFILLTSGISPLFSEQYFYFLEGLQNWLECLHIFLLSPLEYLLVFSRQSFPFKLREELKP